MRVTAADPRTTPVPVRVGIIDHEIISAGLVRLLAHAVDRVTVVVLDVHRAPPQDLDVILVDPAAPRAHPSPLVDAVLAASDAHAVVYTWDTGPQVIQDAQALGARAMISKASGAAAVLDAIDAVMAGRIVLRRDATPAPVIVPPDAYREAGLTARECEILALVAAGLTNQEIAERCFLSINSVKTFIRNTYRKIGVQSRSQAVGWALRHEGGGALRDAVVAMDDIAG